MKFYVAGKWQDKSTVKWLQNELMSLGHQITVDWTTHDFGPDGVIATPEQLKNIPLEDQRGVENCDAFVGVLVHVYQYKGLWVEMGIALARNKLIFTIGEMGDSCIFMHHPSVVSFESFPEFLSYIRKMSSKSPISRNKDIQFGDYCIRGTRIPIKAIRSMIKGGDSIEFLMESYNITKEQVEAALNFRR